MSQYGDAIAGIESGGQQDPYAAIGPVTRTGDRAYGRYQVMGNNVGPWTAEVLGKPMTPQEFAASPQAQDAVFEAKFGQSVAKYGNPQDAASVWFTGRPLAQGAGSSDVNGVTGQGYVDKFNRNLGAQPAASATPAPQPVALYAPPAATNPTQPDSLAGVFQQSAPSPTAPRQQVSSPPQLPPEDPETTNIFQPRTTQRPPARFRKS